MVVSAQRGAAAFVTTCINNWYCAVKHPNRGLGWGGGVAPRCKRSRAFDSMARATRKTLCTVLQDLLRPAAF